MKEEQYYAVWVNDELLASRNFYILKGAANKRLPFGPGALTPSRIKRPESKLQREANEKDGRLVIL